MSGPRTLVFHPALATYRVDLFNALSERLDLKVIFLNRHVAYHRDLNQDRLRAALRCRHDFLLSGPSVGGRDLRTGMGRCIAEFRPDVVVTHEFSYLTLCIILHRKVLMRRRYGLTLWTAENTHLLASRGPARRLLRRFCCAASDSMIVYTHAVRDAFARRGVAPNRIFVCANHQKEDVFARLLDQARPLALETARAHGLADRKIVLFVGRLVALKGLDRVLNAFAQVIRGEPRAALVLVGDGPERTALSNQAAALGIPDRVVFAGHREGAQLLVWYLLAGLSVLASDSETYGAVVNESLLAGVPVLCSSYAGAAEIIREGHNGHVFDPYDTGTLA